MNIKREGKDVIMSQKLVCDNYSDMKHYGLGFENVGKDEYKCNSCGRIMVVNEVILLHDEKGNLKMEVYTTEKKEV